MSDDDRPDALDRAAILTRRRRFIQMALTTGVAAAPAACAQPCLNIPTPSRLIDGVYICQVYADVGCDGCDGLDHGDIIRSIDGVAVQRPEDLESMLLDGRAHALSVRDRYSEWERTAELRLHSRQLPLFTIEARALINTPPWARRRLFGRTSPRLRLVDLQQRTIDGLDLRGRARLLVVFDWSTPQERQIAATMLQVLQKAKGDLEAAGVEPMMAQVPYAASTAPPMSAADLQRFFEQHQLPAEAGGPLPPPRLLHAPESTPAEPGQPAGRRGDFTLREVLGLSPTILVLDARGVVLWHSVGLQSAPNDDLPPDQYPIIEAVKFALRHAERQAQ